MNRILTLLIFAALLSTCQSKSQISLQNVDYEQYDVAKWDSCVMTLKDKTTLPDGELIIEIAKCFLETPYVASTLERDTERLVVNLRELDCTTFVETVIAMALTVKEKDRSFAAFCNNLQRLRYRNGKVNDYTDRLHYFTDWIYENERNGIIKDATQQIGGEALKLDLSFMSTHPESYRQLSASPERIDIIREKEQEISARTNYYALPKSRINDCATGIKTGSVVCFVTNIKGLDVSHVGFVCWQGDTLKLLHASSTAKKVIFDTRPLADYANAVKTTTGVIILAPVF
ncbi:MAG: DUF1460 domain-containing protein [Tannerella sp.]|jgi:hypothetical protein|nr:DUF1460 domain-containing protein [Tannerella sp.]